MVDQLENDLWRPFSNFKSHSNGKPSNHALWNFLASFYSLLFEAARPVRSVDRDRVINSQSLAKK